VIESLDIRPDPRNLEIKSLSLCRARSSDLGLAGELELGLAHRIVRSPDPGSLGCVERSADD